jgi:hypothetical protein
VVLDPNKVTFLERACSFLKIALIFSSVLTVASIFTSFVPPFTKCAVVTLILGLAKSSAEQMSDRI